MKKSMICLTVAAGLALAGCGGSGETTGGSAGAPTGLSTGTITAVGSGISAAAVGAPAAKTITVNKTTFSIADASVTMDDIDAIIVPDLKTGMVAEVKGEVAAGDTTGTATEVVIQETIKGPVASIDADAGSFVVLGQTIGLDAGTILENFVSVTELEPADMVEVHGLTEASGNITATRITKLGQPFVPDKTRVKMKGIVISVSESESGSSFIIGSLTVQVEGELPEGVKKDAVVKVKGTMSDPAGPLDALRIKVKKIEYVDMAKIEVEGFVSEYVSLSEFKVGGIPVDGSAVEVAGVANNVRVEVEGKIVDGVLVATDIDVKRRGPAPAPEPTPVPEPEPAPVPEPEPAPVPEPAPAPEPAPTLDGTALYAQYCADCHGSSKRGSSASDIQNAIDRDKGGMGTASLQALTPAQIDAISKY